MLEPAVILFRLVQYAGAMVLFGSSLFLIYALPRTGVGSGAQLRWARPLLGWSAAAVGVGSLAGLVAQTSLLAGSLSEGLKPASLSAVITSMALGPSALIRAALAGAAALLVLLARPGRTVFLVCSAIGALVSASFAWMGHGAATEGPGRAVHLIADVLHALAAGVWIGALVVFFGLLRRPAADPTAHRVLHRALHGFAGVGSTLVAVLVGTGLVNGGFLVGLGRLPSLLTTPYGQLLMLKLALFVGMLGLAAANRFRLTPALESALQAEQATTGALADLRRSLLVETTLALGILGLVAWLGMLAPVSAQ